MFSAKKITNAFAKVFNEKVIPRIQQKGIDKYKEENPQIQPIIPVETNVKNLRNTRSRYNIEIDTNILDKIDTQ